MEELDGRLELSMNLTKVHLEGKGGEMCVCVCVCVYVRVCVCEREREREREVTQCLILCDPTDYSPGSSSVHGIL